MSDHTKFDYLLNAMERAGQSHNPHIEGYGDKRRALFAHVRAMEAAVKAAQEVQERHSCGEINGPWATLRQALAEVQSHSLTL
jgi:hypothetical protein